jgi:hypothetical protein
MCACHVMLRYTCTGTLLAQANCFLYCMGDGSTRGGITRVGKAPEQSPGDPREHCRTARPNLHST